jgi:hypothetical protein
MNRMFVPGNLVVIKHADGEYSLFAHFKQNSIRVKIGDKVAKGQLIGLCGNSGNSSEAHLHFQVQNTPFFADEPILRVVAPLREAQLIESRLVNLLQFQSMVAAKAARVRLAAPGSLLVDFGMRRAHGAEAGLLSARASYLSGFDGTATVLAGKQWEIPLFGTMAHSFIQAHPSETEAFINFAVSGRPGKPVPTGLVERALTTRGEVHLYGMAGGTGADGRGTAMTDAAIGRLAGGLGTILGNDPLSAGGQVPVRVVKIRHYNFRQNQDFMDTMRPGALASELRALLGKADAVMRVKLLAPTAHEGKQHRVVLSDYTTF